jgi:hypothetical protein
MIRLLFPGVLLLAACAGLPGPAVGEGQAAAPACPPAARFNLPYEERATALEALSPEEVSSLALNLVPCLEAPDPSVRDGFAYETLSDLMRAGRLDTATLAALKTALLGRLADADGDPAGFRGPFAVLVLSEVARTDRISAWMTEAERSGLIAAGADYLAGLTDYRGFDDTEGWRHGVAHTADLFMQLALNPQLTKPQAEAILGGIALKVAPSDHAYVFGESTRLSAPVIYLAQKEMFTEEEWADWLSGLWPPEDPLWRDVYGSEAALTRLHNLRAFADEVYISASVSNEETYEPLAGPAFALMSTLP